MRIQKDDSRKIVSVWLTGQENASLPEGCPLRNPEPGYVMCRFLCGQADTGDAAFRLLKNNLS